MKKSKSEKITEKATFVYEPEFDYSREYTYADYLKFPFEEMVELIRGKVFKMSPAPGSIHQVVTGNIYGHLWSYLKGKSCRVFIAPFDVILPIKNKKRNKATTVVQPDVCVICNPEKVEDPGCFGVPDLVVEVVASRYMKKDVQLKYSVYEEAGVGEYWLVFTEMRCVEVFVLEEGVFRRVNTFAEDDVIDVKTLPGFSISVPDIFDGAN